MTDKHPITPPRELVKEWIAEIWHEGTPVQVAQSDLHLANHAAQWGYEQRGEVNEAELQQARDEELEACCTWTTANFGELPGQNLHLFRRQKPPSLKEQALEEVGVFEGMGTCNIDIIRRALEAIPDD